MKTIDKFERLKLTDWDIEILKFLNEHRVFVSPTVIGNQVGGEYPNGYLRHSSWACPKLKKLVEYGLVAKSQMGGQYKIRNRGIKYLAWRGKKDG